jgi:large subunit ribosomal protein L28
MWREKWLDGKNVAAADESARRGEINAELADHGDFCTNPGNGCHETSGCREMKNFPKLRIFLDGRPFVGILRAPQRPIIIMSRICSIRGSRVRMGGRIHRSGLAKKKGGIGRHVTKVVKRSVSPNLQNKRIWVPELGRFVRVKLSARALKTVNKNGAFATLKKAGLI